MHSFNNRLFTTPIHCTHRVYCYQCSTLLSGGSRDCTGTTGRQHSTSALFVVLCRLGHVFAGQLLELLPINGFIAGPCAGMSIIQAALASTALYAATTSLQQCEWGEVCTCS